jgi:type I restriction enzyme, S subunit
VSGAAFVGPVPKHWQVRPLRLLGRLLKGTGGSKEDVVEEGVPCIRYGDLYTTHNNFIEHARTHLTPERAQDYTQIEYGDVLFAASGETIEEIGKSAVNLLKGARCGGDLVILRPTEPTVARFLGYATDAAPVAAQKSLAGRGTTVKHIYPDELREVVIAVPPLHEQQAIADFLDRETARLDALVAAKQRVLELLTEKRKAIISTAVTRGLDPKAKLRDSGIPWLGEIPADWHLYRLKFLLTHIEQGWSPECYAIPALEDEWGVMRAGCCNGGGFNELDNKALPIVLEPRPELEVRSGDVLMCRASGSPDLIGSVAMVPANVRQKLLLSDKIYRLVIDDRRTLSSFLALSLNSLSARWQISSAISGASGLAKNIAQSDVTELLMPTPPLDEQRRIVKHISRETSNLDSIRAATELTIALLKERRSALIAAAVTGQIELEAAK